MSPRRARRADWIVASKRRADNVMRLSLLAAGLLGLSSVLPSNRRVNWRAPVFEGDTIYAQTEILITRESESRPTVGVVGVKTTGSGRTVTYRDVP